MSLLDDLDLGSFYDKERPLELKGFDKPLVLPQNPGSQQTQPSEVVEERPLQETDPNRAQAYKDIKTFKKDISSLSSDVSMYKEIAGTKTDALNDFYKNTVSPFWQNEFSEGFLETPELDISKPDSISNFFKDVDTRYEGFQNRKDEGDTSFFGEDEELGRASRMLKGKRKYDLIKQKHERMMKDYHQAQSAFKNAESRKTGMKEALMSLPENVRRASENWKEENPGTPLSQSAIKKLLDDQKFESPQYGALGDLLNPDRVDPRLNLDTRDDFYSRKDQARQQKRMDSVAKNGLKGLQKDLIDLNTSKKLKKHGLLHSVLGQIASRSIYVSDEEKEVINLDRIKKSGINKYKGQDIDEAINSLGGEDRIIAAKLIENVGNANVALERAKMFFASSAKQKGSEQAAQELELANKNYHAALGSAIQGGFMEEVEKRGRSNSWFGNLYNAAKSGDLLEDASDYTLKLGGYGDFTKTDAQNLINIMLEMQKLETSETYASYKQSSSDGLGEAFINIFKHGAAIPEMITETLTGYFNTYLTEAPRTVGATTLAGALAGSAGLGPGMAAGAGTGAVWGLRLNAGVASFVMEYVGEVLSEFEKAGVDWHNPNVFMAAFNNPVLMAEVREKAATKAGGVAFFDIISAGIAGKTSRLVNNPSSLKKLPNGVKAFRQELDAGIQVKAARQSLGMAAELGVQGVLSGTGEAVGQLLTLDPGEKMNWDSIAAEIGIDALGPGGWGFATNYALAKFRGGYALEDITAAQDNVLNSTPTADGVVEQVDQAGFRYERRRFNTAQDYLNYVVEQTGMDLNSPTGFLVSKLVGFAAASDKIGNLGIVIADRTPFSGATTRGAYSRGTIFLNKKALSGREDSTPFVLLHEGGHYIQDMFFTPEMVSDMYNKYHGDDDARKLSWAQYKLGRQVLSMDDLSSSDRNTVESSFDKISDTVKQAEWFTAQVAASLAIESGLVGGTKVDSNIKKAVKAMMKYVTGDESVEQFFPPTPESDADGAVRLALLSQLGFDPNTLQNNRAAFALEDESQSAGAMVNPFEVNLANMANWDQKTRDVWARILGWKDWKSLPNKFKRGGAVRRDKTLAGAGDPNATVDLSDPEVQQRLYKGSNVSRPVATETQQGGEGISGVSAMSPEKSKTGGKVGAAARTAMSKGAAETDVDRGGKDGKGGDPLPEGLGTGPKDEFSIAKQKLNNIIEKAGEATKTVEEKTTDPKAAFIGAETKPVKGNVARDPIAKKDNLDEVKPTVSKQEKEAVKPKEVAKSKVTPKKLFEDPKPIKESTLKKLEAKSEKRKEQAVENKKDREAPDSVKDVQDKIYELSRLINEDSKGELQGKTTMADEISEAKKRIIKRKKEQIQSLKQADLMNMTINGKKRTLSEVKQGLLKKLSVYPLDILRELLIPGLDPDSNIFEALGFSEFESIFDGLEGKTLTPAQIKTLNSKIEDYFDNNLPELSEQAPLVEGVLVPYGVHDVSIPGAAALNGKTEKSVQISFTNNLGEEGDIINVKGKRQKEGGIWYGDKRFTPVKGRYGWEILGKKELLKNGKVYAYKYSLKAVTEDQARRDLPWHEVPASAIPGKFNDFSVTDNRGGKVSRQNFRDPLSPVTRQYLSIGQALRGKSKTDLTAMSDDWNNKAKQGIPARNAFRLFRAKAEGSKDYGLLGTKFGKDTDTSKVSYEDARMIGTMVLGALAPARTTSKRRVASMQKSLKANFDPTEEGLEKLNKKAGGRAESYEQTTFRLDDEGNSINFLRGLYSRIRADENSRQKSKDNLRAADLVLIDLMNAEDQFGMTKDQVRTELTTLFIDPNNEFFGLVDVFRAGIDVQSGDAAKVAKRFEDGRPVITTTEEQAKALDKDFGEIEGVGKSMSPDVVGTPDEGGTGRSTISPNSTRKDKSMPTEFTPEESDLATPKPEEGTWQDLFINGIGMEASYDWVKLAAEKLKERGLIPKDTVIVSHPEIRELDASLSRVEADQRHANRTILTPRVLANIIEKYGLDNIVSLPDTNKQGRITEGSPASGMLFYTGILSKMVNQYGKLSKGKKGAVDAGITATELIKRATTLFQEYMDGENKYSDKEWFKFLEIFGGPPDRTIANEDARYAMQKKTAKSQFAFSYLARFITKRVAEMGGLEGQFGDDIATQGASENVVEDKSQEADLDSLESRSAEDLGPAAEVENVSIEEADSEFFKTIESNELADRMMEDISKSNTKKTWQEQSEKLTQTYQKIRKYIDMSDSDMAKDKNLARLIKKESGGIFSPAYVRALVDTILSKDQINSVVSDTEAVAKMDAYIKSRDKAAAEAAEDRAKKSKENTKESARRDAKDKKESNTYLGSEIALVSEMPALLSERVSAAFLASAKGGFNLLPEEMRYKIRVTIFNQHATLEDIAVKLQKDLNLKYGTEARDFFDMMGVVLPTYAKVKIASREFNSRFRQPIVEALKKYGVTDRVFGKYVQALAAGTFNRHVKSLLTEAQDDVKSSIADRQKKINDHESSLGSASMTESTKEELNESIKKYKSEIKQLETDLKNYDESNYHNAAKEFAPSGFSDREAALLVESSKKDPQMVKLLKDKNNIMGLWAKMNATTIKVALETGQIKQEEAFKLITAKSRASSSEGLVDVVFNALGLDKKDPEYAENAEIIRKTFNSKSWKAQRAAEKGSMPDGYHYAPMQGFEDNEFHYEEQESLEQLITGKSGSSSGWQSKRNNDVGKKVMGRRTGVDKPNPESALAHAFLAHDAMVMRGAKIAPGQRIREWYELFLEMHKNRDNLGEKIEWSERFSEVAKNNGIEGLMNDKRKRQIVFNEFNEFFDVLKEHEDGKMPTQTGLKLKTKVVNGKERTVIRKGEIPINIANDPSLFLVKNGGELQFVKFKLKDGKKGDGKTLTSRGARLTSELSNLNYQPSNPWFRAIQIPTRFLAQMYTSFNPDFLLSNAVKDAITGMINITEDEKKTIFKDLINPKNYGRAVKAIYKVEKEMEQGPRSAKYKNMTLEEALKIEDNDWEGWFRFFEANGMRTAFTNQDEVTQYMEAVKEDIGILSKRGKFSKAKMKLLESNIVKTVEAMNAGVENAMRLLVAKHLLKKGFTIQQAVMAGRNISVDFNRKGTLSSGIGSIFLFFNAGVQGNLRMIKSMVGRDRMAAAKLVTGIMAFSFTWGLLQRMLTQHDEDEDGEKEGNHYDRQGDFERDTNLKMFFPGTDYNIGIPLPWGYNLFWMLGQKAANVAAQSMGPSMGGSGIISNGTNAMSNIYSTFNPLGGTIMPGFIAPIYQVVQNETFYGAPITKPNRQFDQSPAAFRSNKNTKEFFVDFSKKMNAWLGGDEITPGSMKRMFGSDEVVNPMEDWSWALSGSDLEHIFEGYTGGPGSTFSRLVSGAYSGINGNLDMNWAEVPVSRRFFREGYSSYMTSKRFYGLKNRVDEANKYVKDLKSGKNIKESREAIAGNRDLLQIKPMVDAADTKRKAIQRLVDKVNASQLSESEKLDKVEVLEKQRVAAWLKVLYKARKMGIDV